MGGFATDDNEVVILWGDGGREAISRAPKSTIARAVLDRVAALRDRG